MKHFSFKSGFVVWVENDEMHCQLEPKKTEVRLYYVAVYVAEKDVYLSFIANKIVIAHFF